MSNTAVPKSRTEVAKRIAREIEDALFHNYPGQGLLGVLAPDFGLGKMFIELPYPIQWTELSQRVNWTGLTAAEKHQVMDRVLKDVRQNVPEEIHPATWFDGILILVDHNAKVYHLARVKKQIDTPDRSQNLDVRVCARERVKKPHRLTTTAR
jgi:hypothetical protein